VFYKSFLCCWGLAFFFAASVSAQTPQFERLGAAEGLSQGMIYDLLQDRNGFLWFATKDGLNRYDGYAFQVFQNNPFNPFSITDNEIQSLLEDHLGRIWIGTVNNGLSVLNPESGKFYYLHHLSNQSIISIAQTPDGAIWAGTTHGVNRLQVPDVLPENNPDLGAVVQLDTFFWEDNKAISAQAPNRIVDLMATKDGKLWISTYRQIAYFDTGTRIFHPLLTHQESLREEFVSSFFHEGPDGSMWVGQPGQMLRFRGAKAEVFRLPELSVFPHTDFAFDAAGNLFIGTRKQIFRLSAKDTESPKVQNFKLFYRFPETGIIGSTRLLIDRSGLLWIGTNGYGLLKYNPGNLEFQHFMVGKSPRRIVTDAQKRVWVWEAGGVFRQLNEVENQLEAPIFPSNLFFQHDFIQARDGHFWLLCEYRSKALGQAMLIQLDGQSLQQKAQYPLSAQFGLFSRIYEDPHGILWALGDLSSLIRFDRSTAQLRVFDLSKVTGYREACPSILMDAQGVLWIGTPHGLVQATPAGENLEFVLHKNDPNHPQSMNCNAVLSLLEDPLQPDRYLWVGTKGGGLNLLDKRTKQVRHLTTAEGLPNNVVYAILPGERGSIWVSTNRGLSKYELTDQVFHNYFSVDGLQDNEFNTVSYARSQDGKLYFGGVNGITAFYPAKLSASAGSPPVFITALKINNQAFGTPFWSAKGEAGSPRNITLDHTQNQLTFEFAAMDFSAPRMNQFRYRLLGTDENWVEPTTANSATYANLAPGKYVFEVITGGSRGIWNGPAATLRITILPPWWQTNWAYALYMLAAVLGAWGFYRFQVNKIHLKNKLAFEHNETLRLAALDRLKTNFFSSVTHEFRTPLTLLLEPARQLLEEAREPSVKQRLGLIDKNAKRLLHFVNQLLDLSKLEAGQMPLELRPGNLASVTLLVMEQFQALAAQNGVELIAKLPEKPIQVVFDAKSWEQIVSNLLSNALKFSNRGDSVTLRLKMQDVEPFAAVSFTLEVEDTGTGISEADLPRVFDRFYQTAHTRGGTGIGLALTKELVEQMGGKISVKSEWGQGTTFRVELSCNPVAMSENGSIAEPVLQYTELPLAAMPPIVVQQPSQTTHAPLILLIEDDTDLRQFLRSCMPAGYRIAEAVDGEDGIQMALELVPDLIVSDLTMPRKDGYEVTEYLKSNPGTSHIPVILLTAKADLESKLQGLQRGADAYLTKPFRADELLAHIENLLASRQRLQEIFSAAAGDKSVVQTIEAAMPPQENEFLQRLIQIVEENLDNESMDADAFARAVFISRSQLHRKISALTGLSLTEFVRNHRLDRARNMLALREGSVSEIAWRTGFPNPKYFSTCFKERFGVAPSKYLSGTQEQV
jgi:signal transduction histidine kinase/ligand-binding sensor domain-containing protein/CheY-like chemotaxis protein/AraC-like DNA-binding protein